VVVIAAALSTACAGWFAPPTRATAAGPPSTFERLLGQARDGDVASRNLVGYMLATGQGTDPDHSEALRWFEAAAEEGDVIADVNVAILRYLGAGGARDRVDAERRYRRAVAGADVPLSLRFTSLPALVEQSCARPAAAVEVGRDAFRTFCSGCHGADGVAVLGSAPSFALGERMEKSTPELLHTVANGHGSMPRWDDKLPPHLLEPALAYARTLEERFRGGIVHLPDEPPALYFRFGAMDTEFGPPAARPRRLGESASPRLEELCSAVRGTESDG
jgi:mono/diheme cytochrome c family protein